MIVQTRYGIARFVIGVFLRWRTKVSSLLVFSDVGSIIPQMTGAAAILWAMTMTNTACSFGSRRKSTLHLEGILINYTPAREAIGKPEKMLPLLPEIKRMVDDNGVMTYQEVFML